MTSPTYRSQASIDDEKRHIAAFLEADRALTSAVSALVPSITVKRVLAVLPSSEAYGRRITITYLDSEYQARYLVLGGRGNPVRVTATIPIAYEILTHLVTTLIEMGEWWIRPTSAAFGWYASANDAYNYKAVL